MRYFDLEEANKVLESIKPLIYDFIEKRDRNSRYYRTYIYHRR